MLDSSIPSPFGPHEQNIIIAEKIGIAIEIDKNDQLTVTACVNPQFDLNLATEALGMMILNAAKYTEADPEKLLDSVCKQVRASTRHRQPIRRI